MNMLEWRSKGRHLPEFMRDFHDQKDLFKAIHDTYAHDTNPEASNNVVNFRDGMIYVIDVFLWFMASRGYTLQKCRTKVEFIDLQETIEQSKQARTEMFAKAMGLTLANGSRNKKKSSRSR